MKETVDAAEVDEDTVVRYVLDISLEDRALLELLKGLFP